MRAWLIALFVALPATAQPAAPAVSAMQAQYSAAQDAFDAGRWAEASAGFAALLPRLKSGASAAVVRARAGTALLEMGQAEAAEPLLLAALPLLAGDDRQLATVNLGRAREIQLDFAGARAAYADAITAMAGDAPLGLRIAVGRSAIYSDPAFARATLDRLLPEVEKASAKDPNQLADFYAIRGRADLMSSQYTAARTWFERALHAAGGLSLSNVSLTDVRVRGDLAIASWLGGFKDDARRFLAYTGAAQLQSEGFDQGANTVLPACTEGGLQPADMAIIEIAIGEDGRVLSSQTIYATRLGGPETLFARAARNWSWSPATMRKLPQWWRSAVRLELRCATGRLADVSIAAAGIDLPGWLASRGVAGFAVPASDAAALPLLRAELARRTAAGGGLALVPIHELLIASSVSSSAELVTALEQTSTHLAAAHAPDDLILAAIARLQYTYVLKPNAPLQGLTSSHARRMQAFIDDLQGQGRLDSRGGAYALALSAMAWRQAGTSDSMVGAYRRLVAIPQTVLPAANPLRQLALLQLANAEAAARRPGQAAELLAATGLQPGQCALLDAPPRLRKSGVNTSDFPEEARRWGFEGFVRLAFDIAADGKPDGVRTVMASPPLVFSTGSEQTARGFRFEPVFRADGGQGCTGNVRTLKYQITKF
jgi:TonB family protein